MLDENFPRVEAARREGLHGAFAFPILLGGEMLGVFEFFCQKVREPDDEMLQLFAATGSQIGQYLHRKRKEGDLRQSEERLRLVARHIGEVLWIVEPGERRVRVCESGV